MSLALGLIVSGSAIAFGASFFAAISMPFESQIKFIGIKKNSGKGFFVAYIGTMILMTLGGLLFVIGIAIATVNFLNQVL